MYEMGRSHPRHRERYSEQTWLTQEHEDGLLQGIRLRQDELLNLELKGRGLLTTILLVWEAISS